MFQVATNGPRNEARVVELTGEEERQYAAIEPSETLESPEFETEQEAVDWMCKWLEGNDPGTSKADQTPKMSDAALSVLGPIQVARVDALGHQHAVGQGREGRAWSIIITQMESLEAIIRYYDTGSGLSSPQDID